MLSYTVTVVGRHKGGNYRACIQPSTNPANTAALVSYIYMYINAWVCVVPSPFCHVRSRLKKPIDSRGFFFIKKSPVSIVPATTDDDVFLFREPNMRGTARSVRIRTYIVYFVYTCESSTKTNVSFVRDPLLLYYKLHAIFTSAWRTVSDNSQDREYTP